MTTPHLPIGDVLEALQLEFPDLTVTKIRFLESQGLIDPERTPSGYRKFYAEDVDRLRWILVNERDHGRTLQEIKDLLDELGPDAVLELPETPEVPPIPESPAPTPSSSAPVATTVTEVVEAIEVVEVVEVAEVAADPGGAARAPSRPRAARPTPPSQLPAPGSVPVPAPDAPTPEEAVQTMTARRRQRELTLPFTVDADGDDGTDGPDSYDRVSLATAGGATEAVLDELERYGLIRPFYDDGIQSFYDRDALVCVRAAVRMQGHGIEPRHLKMYVHFAEREGALFQQVLAPFLRQKNPVSRGKVEATLNELVGESRALRAALLRRVIDDLVGD